MMKITGIETKRYKGDEGSPYVGEVLVITVQTDTDITGFGFASAPPNTGVVFKTLIENTLAPHVTDRDPQHSAEIWDTLYRRAIPRRGTEGIVRTCMAAIDMALWDIKGKALNVPVSHLLGNQRELIPTYANCAHHMPPDALAARAAEYVANGHKALKIRGTRGFVTLEEATDRVREVRAAIGDGIKLMVDVNGSWDVDTAVSQLKAWERYDVYWLEEPVPPDDIPGYARVKARAGSTYIVGGEQHAGLLEFRTLLEQGQIDIVQPNAMVTGGITDFLRIHAFATAKSVPVSPWNLQPVHIHMAAGLPNVKWIEYFMADNALLDIQHRLFVGMDAEEVVTDEGVFLRAPREPGLGLTLDEKVADEALIRE